MNREQIQEQLEEIQSAFSILGLEGVKDKTTRMVNLDDVFRKKDQLHREIVELRHKLKTDANYPGRTSVIYELFYERNINDKIARAEQEMRAQEDLVEQSNRRIEIIEMEIEAGQALLRQGQADNSEYGTGLQNLEGNPDEELQRQYMDAIAATNEVLGTVGHSIEDLNAELAEARKTLENANLRLTELPERISRYKKALQGFKENQEKVSTVDIISKKRDQEHLLALEREFEYYDDLEISLAYDFSSELTALVDGYHSGSITNIELQRRLTDFRTRLPEDIYTKGAKEREKELADNRTSQEFLRSEITRLSAKLASPEENYAYADSVIERNQSSVLALYRRLASLKNSLTDHQRIYDSMFQKIDDDEESIAASNAAIQAITENNIELGFRLTEVEPESAEDEKIRAQMAKNHKAIEKHRENQADIYRHIAWAKHVQTDMEREMKETKGMITTQQNKIDSAKKLISKKGRYDKTAVRADESILDSMKSRLRALESREKLLDSNPRSQLNVLIAELNRQKRKDAAEARKKKEEKEKKTAEPVEPAPTSPQVDELPVNPEPEQAPEAEPEPTPVPEPEFEPLTPKETEPGIKPGEPQPVNDFKLLSRILYGKVKDPVLLEALDRMRWSLPSLIFTGIAHLYDGAHSFKEFRQNRKAEKEKEAKIDQANWEEKTKNARWRKKDEPSKDIPMDAEYQPIRSEDATKATPEETPQAESISTPKADPAFTAPQSGNVVSDTPTETVSKTETGPISKVSENIFQNISHLDPITPPRESSEAGIDPNIAKNAIDVPFREVDEPEFESVLPADREAETPVSNVRVNFAPGESVELPMTDVVFEPLTPQEPALSGDRQAELEQLKAVRDDIIPQAEPTVSEQNGPKL